MIRAYRQTPAKIQQALDNALNPDAELKQPGVPADAAAVGIALHDMAENTEHELQRQQELIDDKQPKGDYVSRSDADSALAEVLRQAKATIPNGATVNEDNELIMQRTEGDAVSELFRVELPQGGGTGGGGTPSEEVWEDIADITLEETVSALHITTDLNGNPFALKEFKAFVVQKPIHGNTSNTQFCMAINGEGWGGPSEMKFKGTPKETDATVYSYFHVKTVDGVMEKYGINSSYDFASLSGSLVEAFQRNSYMTSLRFEVDKSTDSLKTTAMPCVKISIVGYTSNILAAGSRIQVRGIRA